MGQARRAKLVRTPVVMLFFVFILVAFLFADRVLAAEPSAAETLDQKLRTIISGVYPGSRIEIRGHQIPAGAIVNPDQVQWSRDDGKGIAHFRSGQYEFSAEFSAWRKTFVALRRVRPGEKLERSFFELREVEISRGMAREYRGLMLEDSANLESLEADQTILEGHFPLASAVREAPDVRRGEMVKLRLVSGGLVLMTQATASESGHLGRPVRVMTLTSKRQLTGTLQDDGTVEVSL